MERRHNWAVIALVSFVGSVNAHAYQYEVDGLCYNMIDGNSLELVSKTPGTNNADYAGEISVPAHVMLPDRADSVIVKRIGEVAFANCPELISVKLPETIEQIGQMAFAESKKLVAIDATSTRISEVPSDFASGCGELRTVWLPDVVESIGVDAFSGCEKLEELNFPKTLNSIGERSFRNTGISSVVIPDGVTEIMDQAFEGAKVKTVVLPNSLSRLRKYAFSQCVDLSEIALPSHLEVIEEGALEDTDISRLELPATLTMFYPAFHSKSLKEVVCHVENPEGLQLGETGLRAYSLYDFDTSSESYYNNTFDENGFDYEKCTLFVPEGSVELYRNAPGWSKFGAIKPLEKSGIDSPVASGGNIDVVVCDGNIVIEAQGVVNVYSGNGVLIKSLSVNGKARMSLPRGLYVLQHQPSGRCLKVQI